jgi:diguanylate cyclase (GGDEF)-like protein
MDDTFIHLNRRILIVHDRTAAHADFSKVLGAAVGSATAAAATPVAKRGNPAVPVVRSSFDLDFALHGEAGVELAGEALTSGRPYAVAFVNMSMPGALDGPTTIDQLWAVDPHIQAVICSDHANHDWMAILARLGHADKLLIITKPFEPIEVLQCARALTRKWFNERTLRLQMQSLEQAVSTRTAGLNAANKQLRHLATHDALTGLPNRVLLEDRLAQAMIHAVQDGRIFALVLVDIDRLQLINDSFGHRAGDELLQEVARRLSTAIRSVDTLVRAAGDEFLMIINPIETPEDAKELAARALEALKPPMRIAAVAMHATASMGMVFFPRDGTIIEILMARAGAAMHHAKQRGRNNAQAFEPSMDTQSPDTAQLQSDLHDALALRQFELFYQPKVNIATGAVRGVEALIRWRHPTRGLVSPAQFIPFAEDSGLIGPIGAWVVREGCRQAAVWRSAGLPALRVAVNISASQFRQGGLLEIVKEALSDADLDPTYLEMELTESAVMSDPEESVRILEQLSSMDVLVSVDDFGTGYSSMSYLQRFPLDKLKIDRSFIAEILTRSDDASIVRAIVSLAHGLKLKVVAEGVETHEQLEFLRSIDCDEYQGYYFSAALPAGDFAKLMSRQPGDPEAKIPQSEMERTHSKLSAYRAR